MDWNVAALKLEAIAEGLGLNALDYVPDDLPNKAIYVGEIDIQPNQVMNRRGSDGSRMGVDSATVTLRLLVARSDDKHAIRKMREYMAGSGEDSLIQAIQETNNRHTEFPWSGIKVVSARGNRVFNVGEAKFYGTEIDVWMTGAA
jgi:hypothetical protein